MAQLFEFIDVRSSEPPGEGLDGVSFSIAPGENAVFFGIEGSGLRSLTPLMTGMEDRYEGDILFRGSPIRDLDYLGRQRYRNRIGYIHGDYGLISNLNVEQNISQRLEYYAEHDAAEIAEITERLMEILGIMRKRHARPVELTRSEILRAAFARATVHDPELLIIEHAFVDQSPLNIRSFMDVLIERAGRRDRSLIFVTYEPQKFLDFADRMYMLYEGRIVFAGTGGEYHGSDNPYLAQYRGVSTAGPMRIE
ncbi:MAG: ATP-binding cassette domain-containing protein [Spirochaetes bacterium]|nr:ATP-binding cassette domain-containing protein [Spirochaetota bacterium]